MWWEFTPAETIKLEKGVPCAMSMDETTKVARVWTGGQQIESSSMPTSGSSPGATASTAASGTVTDTASDPAAVVANLSSPLVLTAIETVTGIKVSSLLNLFKPLMEPLKGLDPSNLGQSDKNLLAGLVGDLVGALKAVNPGK